jgi:hypothetical protein
LELALLKKDIAEIAMRRRVVGCDGGKPAEYRCGLLRLSLPLERNPQAVVDQGMVGQHLQNIAVKPLRLGQPPGAMVADSRLQHGLKLGSLRNSGHRRRSPSK